MSNNNDISGMLFNLINQVKEEQTKLNNSINNHTFSQLIQPTFSQEFQHMFSQPSLEFQSMFSQEVLPVQEIKHTNNSII